MSSFVLYAWSFVDMDMYTVLGVLIFLKITRVRMRWRYLKNKVLKEVELMNLMNLVKVVIQFIDYNVDTQFIFYIVPHVKQYNK